jgi:hopanoid biosynthesis associated protein HpnK
MVTGDACDEAVELARAHPRLAVGLHLVVASGRPALAPSQVPHLVDSSGRFPSSPTWAGLRYQFLPAARTELRREIRAQLELFRDTGLPLAHVDGHLHLHLHPLVLQVIADLAPEFGIPAVRLPSEELGTALALGRVPLATRLVWSAVFPLLRRSGVRRLRRARIAHADRVYGLQVTGRLTEQYLVELLPRISAEWAEVYCHPAVEEDDEPSNGPPGAGPRELAALLSPRVRNAIAEGGFLLTNSEDAAALGRGGPA